MASGQTHIIDRLQIELNVPNPNRAHKLQEKVSSVLRQELEPTLDRLFDRISGDETVVIDKLELDLGSFAETELKHNFIGELQQKIEIKLSDLTRSDLQFEEEVRKYSKSELYFETLSHYLLTGTYPWFVSQHPDDSVLFDPARLSQTLLSEDKDNLLRFIGKHASDSDFRKRLIYLLDDKQFNELIGQKKVNENFNKLWNVLQNAEADRDRLEFAMKEVQLASSAEITSSDRLLNIFLKTYSMHGGLEQLLTRLAQSAGQLDSLKDGPLATPLKEIVGLLRLQQLLRKEYETETQFSNALKGVPGVGSVKEYLKKIQRAGLESEELKAIESEIAQIIDKKIDSGLSSRDKEEKRRPKVPVEKKFYITNAGLILLWPFLPRFFRKLELTADRQFIDDRSRYKAIHILQYMSSGDLSTYEYIMVLNKLLCGYPVDRPFPSAVDFSENEIHEADSLIESVVGQWEALKNTSVEGFRKSFLQRDARLKEVPKHWELQVESKGFDILLDKLPWGISVVRLPWMDKPIYVDWR